jgi:hypothetical protein
MSRWKRVSYEGTQLFEVGILDDGTLHNPRGYPPEIVRAAVMAVDARQHARRSAAAKKAAVTRQRRHAGRVWQAGRLLANNLATGPSQHCCICGRHLDDPASIQRGIGSECWQDVLRWADIIRAKIKTGAA